LHNIVECIAAIAKVEQELNALSLDDHTSDSTGNVLRFLIVNLRCWLVFLYLAKYILVKVVSKELLLLILGLHIIEFIHWNVYQN